MSHRTVQPPSTPSAWPVRQEARRAEQLGDRVEPVRPARDLLEDLLTGIYGCRLSGSPGRASFIRAS
ncbi:hypothetical protein ACGF12_32275 [Kitasatospora sp. NPDC048296]|uniref:hypothetical protein n=1 Tax=Kitasatospora sp. NPDC048296 TaxID=3364048 RepID=UPI00371A0E3C